jgi:hypothetical protein
MGLITRSPEAASAFPIADDVIATTINVLTTGRRSCHRPRRPSAGTGPDGTDATGPAT